MTISREQALACDDIEYKDIVVPKWGDMRIKMLSIGDQIQFEKLNAEKKTESELVFAMIVLCCVNDKGESIFTMEDVPLLEKKSSASILALFKECLSLNGLNKTDLDKQAKNS